MSQNATALATTGTINGYDYTVAINNALDTIKTNSSGASAPASPSTWQFWLDTTNNLLKQYNGSVWLALGSVAGGLFVPYMNGASVGGQFVGFVNKFRNGNMDVWQRGLTGTITAGTPAYTADGWIVGCTGANISWGKSAGGANGNTYYMLLTGAASVTDSFVKQRIESLVSNQLLQGGAPITFQCAVYNNTGAAIVPTLTVKTPTAADNYAGTTTQVNAVNLQSCPNGQTTTVAYTFATSAAILYGLEATIDFGASLNSGAKTIGVLCFDIRATPSATIGQNNFPPLPELRPSSYELQFCQRYYEVQGSGNGAIYVRAVIGNGGYLSAPLSFAVPKRAAPTMAVVGTWNVANCTQPTIAGSSTTSYSIGAGGTASAEALFVTTGTSTYVTASAEL